MNNEKRKAILNLLWGYLAKNTSIADELHVSQIDLMEALSSEVAGKSPESIEERFQKIEERLRKLESSSSIHHVKMA